MQKNPAEPPTLRELTRQLRALHKAWSHPDAGGEYVALHQGYDGSWHAEPYAVAGEQVECGREYIPGDGKPFDAVAAARRLLADYRDYLASQGQVPPSDPSA